MRRSPLSSPSRSEGSPAAEDGGESGVIRRRRSTAWRNSLNWTRIFHVYTSMLALLVVLFFGLTGVTLNHPEWTFGFDPAAESFSGTLPDGWRNEDGSVQFLTVSEYVRSAHGVDGDVTDFGTDIGDGYLNYREPGYTADVFFDLETGEYRLNVEQQGWIGVMNELHKGRDTGSSWIWLIDISGVFLVVIAVTGLGLQLFLSKRRKAALLWALGGTVVTVLLIAVAVL